MRNMLIIWVAGLFVGLLGCDGDPSCQRDRDRIQVLNDEMQRIAAELAVVKKVAAQEVEKCKYDLARSEFEREAIAVMSARDDQECFWCWMDNAPCYRKGRQAVDKRIEAGCLTFPRTAKGCNVFDRLKLDREVHEQDEARRKAGVEQ